MVCCPEKHVQHAKVESSAAVQSGDESSGENIAVDLLDLDMWKIFNSAGHMNEMIITKAGRKLFPIVKFRLRGLNVRRMYSVALEFEQQDDYRWKYTDAGWSHAGKGEPLLANRAWIHHNSPKFGNTWMEDDVDFSKVKITNKTSKDMIRLNSLHLYEPVIRITRVDPMSISKEVVVFEKHLPMCQFMAVTSYQNDQITHLKIQHNPFAKGFQDVNGMPRRPDYDNPNFTFAPPNYYCANSDMSTYKSNLWPSYPPSAAPTLLPDPARVHSGFHPVNLTAPTTSTHYTSRYNPYARPTVKADKGLDLSAVKSPHYDYYQPPPPICPQNPPLSSYYTHAAQEQQNYSNFQPQDHYGAYQYPPAQDDHYYPANSYYSYGSYYGRRHNELTFDSQPYEGSDVSSSGSPATSSHSDQISPTSNQSFVY